MGTRPTYIVTALLLLLYLVNSAPLSGDCSAPLGQILKKNQKLPIKLKLAGQNRSKDLILEEIIITRKKDDSKTPDSPAQINEQILSLIVDKDSLKGRSKIKASQDLDTAQTQTLVVSARDLKNLDDLAHILTASEYEPQRLDTKKAKRKVVHSTDSQENKGYYGQLDGLSDAIYTVTPESLKKKYKADLPSKGKPQSLALRKGKRPKATEDFDQDSGIVTPYPGHLALSASLRTNENKAAPYLIYPAKETRIETPNHQNKKNKLRILRQHGRNNPDLQSSSIEDTTKDYTENSDSFSSVRKRKSKSPPQPEITTPIQTVNYPYVVKKRKPKIRQPEEVSSSNESRELSPQISGHRIGNHRSTSGLGNYEQKIPQNPGKTSGLISKYDIVPRPFALPKQAATPSKVRNIAQPLYPNIYSQTVNPNLDLQKQLAATNLDVGSVEGSEPSGIEAPAPGLPPLTVNSKSAYTHPYFYLPTTKNPLNPLLPLPQPQEIPETLQNPTEQVNKKSDASAYFSKTPAPLFYNGVPNPGLISQSATSSAEESNAKTSSLKPISYAADGSVSQEENLSTDGVLGPDSQETFNDKTIQPNRRAHRPTDQSSDYSSEAYDGDKAETKATGYKIQESAEASSEADSDIVDQNNADQIEEQNGQYEEHGREEDHEQYQADQTGTDYDGAHSHVKYQSRQPDKIQKRRLNVRLQPEVAESQHVSHGHGGGGGGKGGGDHKFEEGMGEERQEDHVAHTGEKGHKGYKSWHEHEKAKKGHHDEQDQNNHYKEEKGAKKEHDEDGGYQQEHYHGEKGEKEAQFGEKGEHSKGHSTKGAHVVHKKDEYEKKTEFFDESHEDGDSENGGEFYQEHEHETGGHKKVGHHDIVQQDAKHGKHKKYEHGGHHNEEKGHKKSEGHDEHHHHEQKHGNDKGIEEGKKWSYNKGTGGGGGGHKANH